MRNLDDRITGTDGRFPWEYLQTAYEDMPPAMLGSCTACVVTVRGTFEWRSL